MEAQRMEPEPELVNGVSAEGLLQTIEAIREKPELAKVKVRAHNQWIDGTLTETRIHDFYGLQEERFHAREFLVQADEPAVLLGTDHAPGAGEALLQALAACLNTTLIYHAAAKGIQLDELEFELEADADLQGLLGLSDKVRNGFSEIRVKCRLKGDGTEEQLKELVDLAQRRSPVFDVVTHGTAVKVTMERG